MIGLTVAGHGAQKLFGWWEGPRLSGFAGMLEHLGMRPARLWALVAGVGELAGGLLVAIGFLNPLGPLMVAGSMAVAIASVHWSNGFWNASRGIEFPLQILGAAVAISLIGYGPISIDSVVRLALPEPATWLVLAAATALAVAAALLSPRLPQREAARRPTLS